MLYKGGCHCGQIGFEVEGNIEEAINPKGESTVAINVRCLDGLDLSVLKVRNFDGLKL